MADTVTPSAEAMNTLAGLLGLIIIHGSVSHTKCGDAEFLLAELHDCAAQARLALRQLPKVAAQARAAAVEEAALVAERHEPQHEMNTALAIRRRQDR